MKEFMRLEETVSDIQRSLEFTQLQVKTIKQDLKTKKLASTIEVERLQNVEQHFTEVDRQLGCIENQSQQNNVRIDGVPGVRVESWDNREKLCTDIFTKQTF